MTTIPLNQLTRARATSARPARRTGLRSSLRHRRARASHLGDCAQGRARQIRRRRRPAPLPRIVDACGARPGFGRPAVAVPHCRARRRCDRDRPRRKRGAARDAPADQFEAFRALVDKGSDAANIAARFGVSEATVAKRLKLGRVSPVILDAYRVGNPQPSCRRPSESRSALARRCRRADQPTSAVCRLARGPAGQPAGQQHR